MTKILISTFPNEAYSITLKSDDDENKLWKSYLGCDTGNNSEELKTQALSSFFISLIIHDEIYISINNYYYLIMILGAKDLLSLLDRKIIKIIDHDYAFAITESNEKNGNLLFDGIKNSKDGLTRIEEFINNSNKIKTSEKPNLIQFTSNAILKTSEEDFYNCKNELARDLNNKIFQKVGLRTESLDEIHRTDILKLNRITSITEQLMIQNKFEIDSIAQDGFVKDYFECKFGALTNLVGKDTLSPFKCIVNLKGIPDLYNLYKHSTITMDDVLNCRNSFSGGLFRKWYSSSDYNEKEILQRLVNKGEKESNVAKLARFIYPNVLGIINPLTGILASAIDGYIVNKIIEGWSPSLFIDDIYKQKIDQQIHKSEVFEKRQQFVKRYGKIERNAPCPCQSGKKYKHCHG